MPELPEVEVVRRGLAAHVVGRKVVAAEILHPRTARHQAGGPAQFASLLEGRTLTAVARRGKFLWISTDHPGLVLAGHLGMSGQFRIDSVDIDHPHARARLDLGESVVWFLDQRTFGWLAAAEVVLDPRGRAVPWMAARIALDPFDPDFDAAQVARTMRRRRIEVKRALLDQCLVAGIGNIYADEALWRARVHPRERTDELSQGRARKVLLGAAEVMTEALAAGGTSFDSLYVDVNGRSGYFGRGLAVYGRGGQPCPRCGRTIVRERFQNRSSHYCPSCQRLRRRPPVARDVNSGIQRQTGTP